MPKTLLIFSDGTGQIGGLRPDQELSNIYKMYRAMRPGPDSPIKRRDQVAFYDPGLGAGEVNGFTFRRIRNILSSAVGTGIDQNVVDCYCAIISNYEDGDRICLFGFSRGAYTVRSLANVLNLCGVPTIGRDGAPVPRHGPELRKIADDAVRYVYNHGAGSRREQFEDEREKKARRFRAKYRSEGIGADGEGQGNVQPLFVGVFDTVAALGNKAVTFLLIAALLFSMAVAGWALWSAHWLIGLFTLAPPLVLFFWFFSTIKGQYKYFFSDPERKPRWWNPLDWPDLYRYGHMAWWNGKHYDRYIDREVRFLRHALSIDEDRAKFPYVPWGRSTDLQWNIEQGRLDWMKQIWFAGNHSDVGGSYPEDESRLSDTALDWMLTELKNSVPEIQIRSELLVLDPDHRGLQHDEPMALLNKQPSWMRRLSSDRLTWARLSRRIPNNATLHPSVLLRIQEPSVPQMGVVRPYRPSNLASHDVMSSSFEERVDVGKS